MSKTRIGYHASHEQYAPSELLRLTQNVEKAGCSLAMCSDHLVPWSERQGHSGYTWSWLGSALQATQLEFGTVTAPGQRYHPVILAQKIATLAEMFPGRVWVALGSGELMNEHVTGEKWPEKSRRNQRLLESFRIMKALLQGETVSHDGHIKVDRAKLWTKPASMPLLVGAAITAQTAEWMGSWADGLVTIGQDYDVLAKIIEAFRRGGGKSKPIFLQEQIAYAPTYEDAITQAHDQWRFSVFKSTILADTAMPEDIDEISKYVREEDVKKSVRVSDDLQEHREWLQRNVDLGFDRIYLHNVCRKNQDFFERFRESVFPNLKGVSL